MSGRTWLAACGHGGHGGMVKNVRRNSTNVKERGEHEQNRGTYIRFELLDGKTVVEGGISMAGWILGTLGTRGQGIHDSR